MCKIQLFAAIIAHTFSWSQNIFIRTTEGFFLVTLQANYLGTPDDFSKKYKSIL